ncbi:MAG: hypothetical protein AAF529_17925 [Pseudomonadota bacterium]
MVVHSSQFSYESGPQDMWGGGVAPEMGLTSRQFDFSASTSVGGIAGQVSTTSIPAQYVTVPKWIPPSGWGCRKRVLGACIYYGYKNKGRWTTQRVKVPGTGVSFETDTRTGAEVSLDANGFVELTSDIGFSAGTVSAELEGIVDFTTPDRIEMGTQFDIGAALRDVNSGVQSSLPAITGSVDLDFGLRATVGGTQCFIGTGCNSGQETLADVAFGGRLLEMNTSDVPDALSLFGLDQFPVDFSNITFSGDLLATPVGGVGVGISPIYSPPGVGVQLASVTVDYPDIDSRSSGTSLQHTQRNTHADVLSLAADVDGIAPLFGAGVPGGVVVNVGNFPFKLRGTLDLYDIDLVQKFGVSQQFDFAPQLDLTLDFDRDIEIFDQGDVRQVRSWTGSLGDLPKFSLLQREVVVTPSLSVTSAFTNQTFLDLALELSVDLMQGNLSYLGLDILDGGPLLSKAFPAFETSLGLYQNQFQLGSRYTQQLSSFKITAVSEPGLLWLFGLLLVLSHYIRQSIDRPRFLKASSTAAMLRGS